MATHIHRAARTFHQDFLQVMKSGVFYPSRCQFLLKNDQKIVFEYQFHNQYKKAPNVSHRGLQAIFDWKQHAHNLQNCLCRVNLDHPSLQLIRLGQLLYLNQQFFLCTSLSAFLVQSPSAIHSQHF